MLTGMKGKAKAGDYAEVSRQIRNLLHPGRYLSVHFRHRITAKYLHNNSRWF